MHTERLYRILIIEDDPADREVYKRCLDLSHAWKFECAESDSALSGIELTATWRPDCVLLDFNLPDMDGIEALSRLKNESGRMPCAAVMLTAFGDEALAVRAMKAGAMDYLSKGRVGLDTLRQTILNAVERFEMQERIEAQRAAIEESGRRYQVLLEAIPEMVWTADSQGRIQYANTRWSEYTGFSLDGGPLQWDHAVHPEDRERSDEAWGNAIGTRSILELEHRLRRASDGRYRWHLVRAVPMIARDGDSITWFGTSTDIEVQKQMEKARFQKQKLEGIGLLAGGVAHDFNNLLVGILGGASYAMECIPAGHPAQPVLRGVVQAGKRAAELTRKMLAYAGKGAFYLEMTDFEWLIRDTCSTLRGSIPPSIKLEVLTEPDLPQIKTDAAQLRQMLGDLVMNAVEAIGEDSSGTIIVRTTMVDHDPQSAQASDFDWGGLKPGRYLALEVIDDGCGMDDDTRKKVFDPFFSTKFTGRGLGLAAVQGFVHSSGGSVHVESAPGQGSHFRILLPAPVEVEVSRSGAC